jgi:hypothetical protein
MNIPARSPAIASTPRPTPTPIPILAPLERLWDAVVAVTVGGDECEGCTEVVLVVLVRFDCEDEEDVCVMGQGTRVPVGFIFVCSPFSPMK